MNNKIRSIRPFIGAKDFGISRAFYADLGFEEIILEKKLSLFKKQEIAFYLQDAYVKDWVDNTMLFLEVDDAEEFWKEIQSLQLLDKYETVKLNPIRIMDWGKEFFVHDPSGILWHFGTFN